MNEIFSKEKTKLFKNGGKKGPSQLATNRPLRRLSRTKFNSGNQSFSLEIQILANHVTLEKQFSKFLPDNFRIMRQSRQQLKPINSNRKVKMLVHIFTVSKEKWHALTPKRAGFWWKLQMLKAFHTWFTQNQRVKRHHNMDSITTIKRGLFLVSMVV